MKRRHFWICAVVFTIALGILSRKVRLGVPLWDKSLGDALYTVMLYAFAAIARPRASSARLGVFAIGLSIAIEVFQLTGIPLRLPRIFQVALGTTFAWHDVACYLVGGALVMLADHVIRDDARTPA